MAPTGTDAFPRPRDPWVRLARKFGKRPVVSLGADVWSLFDDVAITAQRRKSLAAASLLTAAAGGLGALAWVLSNHVTAAGVPVAFCLGVGGLLLLSALYLLLSAGAVYAKRSDRDIHVRYGVLPFARDVALPREGLGVRLAVSHDTLGPTETGAVCLDLCRKGRKEGTVRVAKVRSREHLLPAYEALNALLAGEGGDETLTQIELPDGSVVEASVVPLRTTSAGWRDMTLAFPRPDVAVVRPAVGSRLFFLAFLAFGVFSLASLPGLARGATESKGAWIIAGLAGIAGVVFTGIGWAGLSGRLGLRSVVLDRRRGVLRRKGGPLGGGGGLADMALDRVAAVQVCSRLVQSDQVGFYVAYQLNLILRQPVGERLPLMCHADEPSLKADARHLAEFLDRPLLDHSRPAAGASA